MLSKKDNSCPFWVFDDVTQCGRVRYINYYFPSVVLISGLLYWIYNILIHHYKYDKLKLKQRGVDDLMLADGEDEENKPLLQGSRVSSSYNGMKVDGEELKERHFSLQRLKLTKPNGEPHGKPELVRRNFFEKSRTIVEFLLVLTQFSVHLGIWLNYTDDDGEFTPRSSLVQVLVWGFLGVLVTLRLWNINQSARWVNKYCGNMWSISFTSYMLMFFSTVLPFRSICIDHIKERAVRNYYLSQFGVDLVLFGLLFLSPSGNKLAVVYRTDDQITPSPEPVSSIASFITWSWLDKFVWQAHRSVIEKKDVWGLRMDDYAIFVIKKFKQYVERKGQKKSFTYNLLTFFTQYLLLQGFWAVMDSTMSFAPTILLKRILEYVDDRNTAPGSLAWFYVCCMFFCRVFCAIFSGQALFFGRRVCIRMKAIIISEIYTKALRRQVAVNSHKQSTDEVDPQELNEEEDRDGDEESGTSANLGAIINLMAVDAFKVSEICAYLHAFVEAVAMSCVAIVLLYRLLGLSAIVGAILIVAMMPVNFKLVTWLGHLQKKSLSYTDKRIQTLNEAFQAIRIIKFFSWESNFEEGIQAIRNVELKLLLQRSLIWALSAFVWYITPTIVTSSAFAFYIFVQKETLTTPIAFTALSLFSLLRTPLDQLSDMLSFVIQSKVSLDRVQEFLEEPDTDKYNQLTVAPGGQKIAFENATISWDSEKQDFKLRNMDIDFKVGKLNVVIGPTGSGKTSILMALLGEMKLLTGNIVVPSLNPRGLLPIDADGMTNSIAYCSQAAWLLNDTVRSNILFNSPYSEARYNDVIEACGLKRDFEILSAGDMTEIGERGITLSGGQKQRISLARALYSNSRHLLLDDCLSAVDSHTASWIYDNCITGPLMEGRTCILISHNIALTLRNAELVVLLENGQVKAQGDPMTLLHQGYLGADELVKSSIMSRHNSSVNLKAKSSTSVKKLAKTPKDSTKPQQNEDERKKAGKLVKEETKAEGVVGLDVYKWYLKIFGGWKTFSILVSAFVFAQCMYIGQSWWVRDWASHNVANRIFAFRENLSSVGYQAFGRVDAYINYVASLPNRMAVAMHTEPVGPHSTFYYLTIYFLIGVAQSVLSAFKTILSFIAGLNASKKIFNLLLKMVLHAKLRFFDSTPIGRIMNRFSKDIEAVDQELTPFFEGAFYSLVTCVSTVVLITFITPQFLIVAVIIAVLYYFIGYFYLAGSRELKRLDSISRSPIYQHFSETLVGVTTIRAFGDESRFIQENLHKIDENNRPFFYLWVANRWLAMRIDLIGSLVVFGAGVFILLNIDHIDSGMAGISLTYAITFTEGALWLVRLYSNVEMNMNSVERLKEYMVVDQEPYNQPSMTPPLDWPQQGRVEMNDLSLRYAPGLPRVIKNVTFTVEPKSKVGVVGRTGAGKSTIITALFRFLDPETGHIKIDNVDISLVDLQRLRRSITIIPQDPTLFTGTVKSNLDPYDEYSEHDIFAALKRVNLVSQEEIERSNADVASVGSENVNKFLDLNSEISEGGGNLSQGQRQLVCLARSLLRSPKIILLDEATASIDYQSDAKIQETIRKEFYGNTILTIAHRLRSVIDYDKILVMDQGEVKEYDHPYSLLLNKNSQFYSMCESSGELEVLIELAKEAFVEKLNSK
ncbi:Transporter of the ATP-binding cassette [Zygosaccharomyces mellis]|uniref:Transporter of the ATP-binding cassette n=1 Tax=Zygosaccharomyces mellis TaxID=42258 RepID=A0A4C2EAU7_9SACH|nr:Transporter of the ATP-binding cassette [Zygosaccharomyces mellis]